VNDTMDKGNRFLYRVLLVALLMTTVLTSMLGTLFDEPFARSLRSGLMVAAAAAAITFFAQLKDGRYVAHLMLVVGVAGLAVHVAATAASGIPSGTELIAWLIVFLFPIACIVFGLRLLMRRE
jgi:hypothetical protein